MPVLGMCRCCRGKVSSEAPTCPHCGQPDPYDEWLEVKDLVRLGHPLQAIKLVRDRKGWDLQQAKDFVDSLKC